MKMIDLLHRWTGGLIGLLLALLGLSGALLVHKNAWTLAPHAHDRRSDDISQLATATQMLMADPASRPQSITYASDDFGLLRLLYKAGNGAYADQHG
ncbi:MAG: PepSY domain-containing protein, partial [Alphaproteobacteria bacterium]|nr:PepSY domain-containing protein [Alphaproteobacteria bacterium]